MSLYSSILSVYLLGHDLLALSELVVNDSEAATCQTYCQYLQCTGSISNVLSESNTLSLSQIYCQYSNILSGCHLGEVLHDVVREGSEAGTTLHPAPCALHPAPCTLHPAPCTLHPAPCTPHPTLTAARVWVTSMTFPRSSSSLLYSSICVCVRECECMRERV